MRANTATARLEDLTVPGIDRAVGHVRRWLRDMVGTDHPLLYEFTVCVSEVMTNALRYSDSGRGGSVRIELAVAADELRARVSDDGGASGAPHLCDPDGEGERGRGLHIVNAYAHDWGVERTGPGFTVWFTLRS
ncbi:ATP-binding protein [Actinomadura barringtoniae]|uniref:ATP-binding protein n=1 Tax=Actinomadura barringtoniae TaxID=1427535 RepID=A0A939PAW6_9ACTN|nr:ATP-binding protein [Actinomadura barringtoniae]MBO2446643.1 ATP-binding protein [Actinomadura barringtoniae]